MSKEQLINKLVFTVDSALLSELGEKLVESVHIALIELVKNAYDADATLVRVEISPGQSGHNPEIKINDNGSGMTFDEVTRYWMRIATTIKIERDISPKYGRPRTGSKGIGRFSCRRLGNVLQMMTIAKIDEGHFEETLVTFNWQDFKPGTDVTKIECLGARRIIEQAETGTTLLITGSQKDEWSVRGYQYLKRQLAVLVANRGTKRPGFVEDPGFNIILQSPDFEGETTVDLRDQLIDGGWGTLTAYIDEEGHAICSLKALKIGSKKIRSVKTFSSLRDVRMKIGIIHERKDQMRNPQLLSLGTIRQILPEWGGVQVRFRGFRVYPFGEPHDDWLQIEHDRALRRGLLISSDLINLATKLRGVDYKRVLLSLLSSRNYIGNVEIGPENKSFEMKTNREGFLAGLAIQELREFVRYAINWSTVYRDYSLRVQARQESEKARAEFELILESKVAPEEVVPVAIDFINKEVKNITNLLPAKQRQKVEKGFTSATQAILKHEQLNIEELRHLRLIASTSTLLLIFTHDVKSFLSNIDHNSIALSIIEEKLPEEQAGKIRAIRNDLIQTKLRLVELLDMTSLISVDSKRAEPKRLALAARLEKARRCFVLLTRTYDIEVDVLSVPKNIKVGPILEAELYAILLNVLSNAVKSVISAGGSRRIQISGEQRNKKTIVHVRDTGMGITLRDAQDVFIPFVADPSGQMYEALRKRLNPEDEYILGTGSGLGLSIVREILQSRNGAVQFVKPQAPWRADLEIVLP